MYEKQYDAQDLPHPVDHQAMNRQVERVIGLLAAKTRALLMDKGVDQKYWPLALEVASYLLNRMPHESLGGLSDG